MPQRIIKKIRELTKKPQKAKRVVKKPKIEKKKTQKPAQKQSIHKKIDEIKAQRQRITQEKILKKKEKRLKKQLNRFASKKKSVKGDYKTRFPIFGRGRDEDAQEVERYESRLSLEHTLELDLEKIQRTLKRIEEGKYGICLVCKKEIKLERLKIYPEAEHCMTCHKKGL